jgi:hypothetical protein
MNNRPLYENLDTAFVNLSALVKYLKRREFVGRIRVELNNYEADVTLTQANKLAVREHDKVSGRVSEGEEAFHRLLIRARESGGTIHVFQAQAAPASVVAEPSKTVPVVSAEPEKPVTIAQKTQTAPATNGAKAAAAVQTKPVEVKPAPTLANHPTFPFELSNSVEAKAKRDQISDQDWQVLLGLTGELLGVIDQSLASAKLDFKSAFSKARAQISNDYPFFNQNEEKFSYSNGKVTLSEKVGSRLFVSSIIESLRRIIEKLGANPKFAVVYRETVQKLLALINQRKPLYDRFGMTAQLKRIIGV